jgi:predicted  nucleic acid-binding Zn-ribbon protein
MRKVEVLRELQTVDTARDQAQTRLAQIRHQWGRREPLDAAIAVEQEATSTLRHWETEQQDLELEVGKMRAKLKADTDKLYSGRGSPRELQDLSHEVDQDARQVSDREDRLLAVFDEVDAAQKTAQQATARREEIETAWKREQERLAQGRRELEAEIARLTAQRDQIAAQSDPVGLRQYESLRRSKGGLAVVAVQQRTCQACRITLPSSEEQKARTSNDLVTCNSCGRILYAVG